MVDPDSGERAKNERAVRLYGTKIFESRALISREMEWYS